MCAGDVCVCEVGCIICEIVMREGVMCEDMMCEGAMSDV